ncbi:ectoine/hydroxyectoine ABC transporter permease subunit EhuC [Ammoniphilus sp. 3BR4]|uniref:ectoine/hydroxyectoine ABC transporter permease subunit EhuC n=1 Tax=Ammoniphilus sp. 3BR4 TaxID=3158265 RepID=UPI0034670908
METLIQLVPPLLKGAWVTIQISLFSVFLGFILSFVFGLARLSNLKAIRFMAACYVEVIRGTSLLVQLFWVYFALPLLGVELSAMAAGVLALGMNMGAYGAEIVRSAILAIPKGQTEATIALNMTPLQRMRLVILPQAFVRMLPPFGNLMVELIKGTALVSLITLSDLTFQGMLLRTTTMQTTEIFTFLLLIYFIITYPCTWGMRWLEQKMSVGRL